MSEFSTLTTRLVTPLLRKHGFKKYGSFERSPTHDSAIYRQGDLELQLTFSFHPYDYPEIGIRMELKNLDGILFNQLYPPIDGGTEAILQAVINDIYQILPNIVFNLDALTRAN